MNGPKVKLWLGIGLVLVLALHGLRAASTHAPRHDDVISYLAATAHQADYAESAPVGRWTTAAEWARLWHPGEPAGLATIGRDLADHDIHPPLYFWLLRSWIETVGVHAWGGPALNLLFLVPCYLALFFFARAVLGDDRLAVVVAVAWGASPAVVRIGGYTRPYALLALCTVLFALLLHRAIRHSSGNAARAATLAALSAVTAAGLLTHYHFALVVLAGGLVLLVETRGRIAGQWPLQWPVLASLAAGGLVFWLLHPAFLDSFHRQAEQAGGGSWSELPLRVARIVAAVLTFFSGRSILALALFALALAGMFAVVLRRRRPGDETAEPEPAQLQATRGRYPLVFLAGTFGAVSLYYVGLLSPLAAMADRYLAFVYPFLVFLPIVLLLRRTSRRARLVAATIFCASQLVQGALDVSRMHGQSTRSLAEFRASGFAEAPTVLLDSVARGVVPALLWHAPGDARVFAATQGALLADPGAWLDDLRAPAYYASDLRYDDSSEARRQAILELVEGRGFEAEDLGGGPFGTGRLYRLTSP